MRRKAYFFNINKKEVKKMPISDKNYALKILMAGVNVKDKKAFIEGLEELISPGGSGEGGNVTIVDVENKITEVIGTAPAALDTLEELAAALGDDPNFATTVVNQINQRVTRKEMEAYFNTIYEEAPVLSDDDLSSMLQ